MLRIDRLHVAVIDDDPAVRGAVGLLLTSLGSQTTLYAGARPFLEALARGNPAVHVIIVDLHMPDMSGAELLEALPALQIHLPAVVLSADPDGELAHRALHAGARAVLAKPVDADPLVHALAEAAGLACDRSPGRTDTWNP